jgi:hypothetical protein
LFASDVTSARGKYRSQVVLVTAEVPRSDRLLDCEHAGGQAQYHQRFGAEHGLGLSNDGWSNVGAGFVDACWPSLSMQTMPSRSMRMLLM